MNDSCSRTIFIYMWKCDIVETTIETIVVFLLMSNLVMRHVSILSKCHIYLVDEEDLRDFS